MTHEEVNLATAEKCPKCGANWRGDEIPAASRENYGGDTHFRRVVARVDRDLDRVVAWICPDCHFEFERRWR